MFWKKNRLIDEFAQQQADAFFSQVSFGAVQDFLEGAEEGGKKRSKRKGGSKLGHEAKRELELTINRLAQFKDKHRLGVYGKARFHLKFKSRLVELGYPDDVAGAIDRAMMLNTS